MLLTSNTYKLYRVDSNTLVTPRALNFSAISIDNLAVNLELVTLRDELALVIEFAWKSKLTLAIGHIVNKGACEYFACLESESALATSLSFFEFALVDRSVCIHFFAESMRLAVEPIAIVGLAISHCHLTFATTLTFQELPLVNIAICAD